VLNESMPRDLIKVKVMRPSELGILPFSKSITSVIYNRAGK